MAGDHRSSARSSPWGRARLRPALAGRRLDRRASLVAGIAVVVDPRSAAAHAQKLHAEARVSAPWDSGWPKHSRADFIEDPYCWAYYWAGRVFPKDARAYPRSDRPVSSSCWRSRRTSMRISYGCEGRFSMFCNKGDRRSYTSKRSREERQRERSLVWRVPGPFGWAPLPARLGTELVSILASPQPQGILLALRAGERHFNPPAESTRRLP